ncbi:MAG: SDR family NAD(P)-dependent oxidoreductase, partial [Phycisphaerae bacterium]
ILGGLQNDGILGGEREADDADMEALAKLSTLRAIVEWVEARVGESGESESGAGDNGAPKPTAKEGAGPIREVTVARDPQPRMLLQAVEAPLAQDGSDLPVEGTVLITDDRSGVAQHLASRLESAGVSCVITPVDASGNGAPGGSATNLADPAAAARFVERLRKEHGRIAAIVHLHPMHNQTLGEPLDPIRWRAALDAELNSLFNLVQGLESDLRQGGTGAVLAAVRMGGRFGSVETEQWAEFRPGQGGVCGLVKSLAREWEDVNCKVIDFDLEASPQDVAESVMAELVARDGRSEVGYCQGARTALAPTQITLQGRDVALDLDCDSVVVVTGGARGITADVALELAERFSLKLVLLGRSPLPPAQEASETASVSDARQLKAVIRSRIEREGQRATPALVETQYKQLCRQREMRANLAAMREAGATVDYRPVDVSDSAAFAAALDDIYAQYGRIDGAIHGAGLIEDKRVCDKTPESFARVMNPKVNGALVLAHKLRSESLRFLVFFSSVSGRYGNKGQCDYAAANEVLNKLAVWLNARWPGRVTSLNWGPWESSGGMVSAELAKQFAQAGIRLIGRREGRHLFLDELLYGTKNEAEVVLGGPLRVDPVPPAGSKRESVAEASADLNAPLLIDRVASVHQSNGSIEVARRLDPAHDVYLLDHQLDGAPVMPMAMMLELFAEVASSVRPGLHLVSLRDVRMLGGITLADDARPLVRVFGSVTAEVDGGVDVDLRAECDDNGRTRYAATAQLRPSVPPSIESSPLQLASPRALGLSVSEAYRQWLFHGPIFAGITEVEAVGDDGIIARISASSPQRCLAESSARGWQVDPVVVDCSLQLLIIWSRTYLDATPLPSRLGCYHRYGGQLRGDLRCEVRIVSVEGPTLRSDVRFYNAAGSLVGRMDDMELTCSQVLNRLAGAAGGRA